jgi:hypothetical protein
MNVLFTCKLVARIKLSIVINMVILFPFRIVVKSILYLNIFNKKWLNFY